MAIMKSTTKFLILALIFGLSYAGNAQNVFARKSLTSVSVD